MQLEANEFFITYTSERKILTNNLDHAIQIFHIAARTNRNENDINIFKIEMPENEEESWRIPQISYKEIAHALPRNNLDKEKHLEIDNTFYLIENKKNKTKWLSKDKKDAMKQMKELNDETHDLTVLSLIEITVNGEKWAFTQLALSSYVNDIFNSGNGE